MRKTLNAIYDACAWLAALLMVGVLLMVLLSVVSRLLHFHVPGTDSYAGYAMAGAGFMALAHTLNLQTHHHHSRFFHTLGALVRFAQVQSWKIEDRRFLIYGATV